MQFKGRVSRLLQRCAALHLQNCTRWHGCWAWPCDLHTRALLFTPILAHLFRRPPPSLSLFLSKQKLRREAERAKRALSSQHQVRVEIESLVEGVDLSEPLTRARFEELNSDLFKKTLTPVRKVRVWVFGGGGVVGRWQGVLLLWCVGGWLTKQQCGCVCGKHLCKQSCALLVLCSRCHSSRPTPPILLRVNPST